MNRKMILLILVATIPTGLIGVVLEYLIKDSFSSLPLVAVVFLSQASCYISLSTFGASSGKSAISYTDALLIGTVQGIAVFQEFRVQVQQFKPVSCLALNDPSQLDFRFFFQFLPFSALSCSKEGSPVACPGSKLYTLSSGNCDRFFLPATRRLLHLFEYS